MKWKYCSKDRETIKLMDKTEGKSSERFESSTPSTENKTGGIRCWGTKGNQYLITELDNGKYKKKVESKNRRLVYSVTRHQNSTGVLFFFFDHFLHVLTNIFILLVLIRNLFSSPFLLLLSLWELLTVILYVITTVFLRSFNHPVVSLKIRKCLSVVF